MGSSSQKRQIAQIVQCVYISIYHLSYILLFWKEFFLFISKHATNRNQLAHNKSTSFRRRDVISTLAQRRPKDATREKKCSVVFGIV